MTAAAMPAGAASDVEVDWHSIPWEKVHRNVRRLQARIVKAVRAGRWGKVKALVYLLTHSFAGRAKAILRVVSNSGAKTPGVDGIVWNTPELKSAAVSDLRRRGYQPRPLLRAFLRKLNGKLRPLGIPVMKDRAHEALHLLGLDPISETLADWFSYGFRLERCCADALERLHTLLCNRYGPVWVLEGDIRACFDSISHRWLLQHIPMDKETLRKWLKAGFLWKQAWFATTEGTPQGGIASPVLANMALDGLQKLLADRFSNTPARHRRYKVHLVRYADDFIITGTSEVVLRMEVMPLVEQFLKERGLELSHEKTKITHVEAGFDFLGQTVRRYPSGKVILKPSRRSIKTFLTGIRETIKNSGCKTAGELILRLNQQIKGWTMYHRYAASKRIFNRIDSLIFRMVWRWCRRRHRKKNTEWIKKKYFPRIEHRDWVFTGYLRTRKGKCLPITLMPAAKVKIIRHVGIQKDVNPYDPAWEEYLEKRLTHKMKQTLKGQARIEYLWNEQDGRCPVCDQPIRIPDECYHIHHRVWRCYGGSNTWDNLMLLHANCHRQFHVQAGEELTE